MCAVAAQNGQVTTMKQTPTDGVTWETMAGPISNAAVSPVERSTGLCVAIT